MKFDVDQWERRITDIGDWNANQSLKHACEGQTSLCRPEFIFFCPYRLTAGSGLMQLCSVFVRPSVK